MNIIKDNREIKYLYHYTKNINVDKILESGKITSSDRYVFFTDSFNKSVNLFKHEMDPNTLYFDLDYKLKRRNYGNPEDYKIIKIPYYNDGKFVIFDFNNNDKDNIYNKSVIHDGELYFNREEVEVLDIPKSKTVNYKVLDFFVNKLAFLFLLLAPLKAKADTWLDDPSYIDTTWFNPDTYNSTSTYYVTSAEKLAGLIYLVNEEGYTFEGKRLELANYYCTRRCGGHTDMTAHDWVPLNGYFKGVFISDLFCGYHKILLHSVNAPTPLIEHNLTVYYSGNYSSSTRTGSSQVVEYEMEYTVELEEEEGVSLSLNKNIANSGDIINVNVSVEDGYVFEGLEVRTKTGGTVGLTKNSDTDYSFYMPSAQVFVFPVVHKVDNGCKVISGTGKNAGDEVVCDKEHFYIIKSNENEVKMISKYNLYTGYNIYKEKIVKSSKDTRSDATWCNNYASYLGGINKTGGIYEEPGYCFIALPIYHGNIVRQNEEAISAHWDSNGNYSFPFIGDVYISGSSITPYYGSQSVTSDFYIDESSSTKYDGYFYDLTLGNNNITSKLTLYKNTLGRYGINVKDITLITLDDINEIVKLNNKIIPYQEWRESSVTAAPPHYEFAFLNDLLTDKQKFIYDTTYWVRTGYDKSNTFLGVNSIVFINTFGGVCGGTINFNTQSMCGTISTSMSSQMAAGLRPVITISPSDLEYMINIETDDNYEIEVVNYAKGNDTIYFRVNSKSGRKLNQIIVRTDSGEEIEFTEGDLIMNDDGTISIDKSKFTMPFESVTLVANLASDNPETGVTILKYIIILFVSISGLSLIYYYKDKIKNILKY